MVARDGPLDVIGGGLLVRRTRHGMWLIASSPRHDGKEPAAEGKQVVSDFLDRSMKLCFGERLGS